MRTASDESSRRARWDLAAGPGFSPRDVPEVAAGYFWDAASASGIGTAAFKVPEGNGHSSFDLVQATVASQPTVLTENGARQFRMRPSTDPNPSLPIITAGNVTAGWTGPTMIAGWFRVPNSSGDIPVAGVQLFSHSLSSGTSRRIACSLGDGSPDRIQPTTSSDGTNQAGNTPRCTNPFIDTLWAWIEIIFDPSLTLGGSSPADVVKVFKNLVRLTDDVTIPTTAAASLNNTNTQIVVGSFAGGANGAALDWSTCYYANGIPSRANRVALANYRNPSGVLLV